jgi:hypothetical protein
MGGLMGGAINGTIASLNGRSFWNGVMQNPQPAPLPMPNTPSPELKLPNSGRSEVQAMPAEKVSPNVGKVLKTIDAIKTDGGSVNINNLNAKYNQELNMTIQHQRIKLDIRIETHIVPNKYGGSEMIPVRHLNLDLTPKSNPPLPNNGHVILK